jgi:hypothetical protein
MIKFIMNKKYFGLVLVLVMILTYSSSFSAEPIPKSMPDNYCKNPSSWTEWDALVEKYPDDMDVQTLHALRLGLCIKIEQGSITLKKAIDLFDRAHEMVIQKQFFEQRERSKDL